MLPQDIAASAVTYHVALQKSLLYSMFKPPTRTQSRLAISIIITGSGEHNLRLSLLLFVCAAVSRVRKSRHVSLCPPHLAEPYRCHMFYRTRGKV